MSHWDLSQTTQINFVFQSNMGEEFKDNSKLLSKYQDGASKIVIFVKFHSFSIVPEA